MKKAKFIIKVNSQNYAKIYANKKWHKQVTRIAFFGEPYEYSLLMEKYKFDKFGKHIIDFENEKLAKECEFYKFGRKS